MILKKTVTKIEIRKTAVITDVTEQDGSYPAELLLRKGYEVHRLICRASVFNTARVEHYRENKKFSLPW
tara:strand:- start:487 stop:693 length:207 start_codon:yes stop_codon:yes gene_type:complete